MTVRIIRIDDFNGSDQAEQIDFEVDGKRYSIDLGPRNRARFFRSVRPFIEKARLVASVDPLQPAEKIDQADEEDLRTVIIGEMSPSEDSGAA